MDFLSNLAFFRQQSAKNPWLQENSEFLDFNLQTDDGGLIPINGLLLSSSLYFKALLDYKILSKNRESILIPEVSKMSMEQILAIVHGNANVNITCHNVCELIIAADYLLFPDIVKQCKVYMTNTLSLENCIKYFNVFDKLWHLDLAYEFYRYMLVMFKDIVQKSNTIGCLSFYSLQQLLSEDCLIIANESFVWSAIVQWLNANDNWIANNLRSYSSELLNCLRLDDLERAFINETMLTHPLIQNNNYSEVILRYLQKRRQAERKNKENLKSRLPNEIFILVRYPTVYGLVPEESRKDFIMKTTIYEMIDNKYDYYREIGVIKNYVPENFVIVSQYLFFLDYNKKIMGKFDFLTGKSEKLPCIRRNIFKRGLAFCYLDGIVYAFGFGDSFSNRIKSSTFHAYDIKLNAWAELTPSFSLHYEVELIPVSKSVYAAGYSFRSTDEHVIHFERYDIETDTWVNLDFPKIRRLFFKIIHFNQYMYVYGGCDIERNTRYEIEIFDLKGERWKQMGKLPPVYCPIYVKLMVLQGKLVVFDRVSPFKESIMTVDPCYWDEDKSLWVPLDNSSPIFNFFKSCPPSYDILIITDKTVIQNIRYGNPNSFVLSPLETSSN